MNFGNVRISELAAANCLSEKQFQRIFLEDVGLLPKQFMRIVRLQYAFYQVQHGQASTLTDLAFCCGYYDQAHFINDCKMLTGYSPKHCFEDKNQVFSDYFGVI